MPLREALNSSVKFRCRKESLEVDVKARLKAWVAFWDPLAPCVVRDGKARYLYQTRPRLRSFLKTIGQCGKAPRQDFYSGCHARSMSR
jgi:hypothetical protein